MLPSVLPTESDHVPVLAEEIVALLDPAPGRDRRRRHLRRRRPLLAARRAAARRRQADRDRPRPHRRSVLRALAPRDAASRRACITASSRRCCSSLPSNGVKADVILLDLGVSSMQLDRPDRGFSYAVDAPLDMRMDPSATFSARELVNDGGRARPCRHLQALRRRALRAPDRARDRAASQDAAVRAHRRSRRGDQGRDPGAGALRRGASGQARLPGAADRGQRRARRGRARAAGCARDAAARRPARGDLVPLARGPDREALPAHAGARLHLPARLPGLRMRLQADDARDAAPRRSVRRAAEIARNPRAQSARLRVGTKVDE